MKPKMNPPDPSCSACRGRGFVIRQDGGAGSASPCRCRFYGAPKAKPQEDDAPQGVLDLEALAAQMEDDD